jgi:hypothetical protein
MKKTFLAVIVIVAASLAVMAFTYTSKQTTNPPQLKVLPAFPEDVQKVLDNSCVDCHSDASSNDKSKAKLNLTDWTKLSDSKKVGKMQDMLDVLGKGEMPPEKYVAKFPEHALTKENKDLLVKYLNDETTKLMGQ